MADKIVIMETEPTLRTAYNNKVAECLELKKQNQKLKEEMIKEKEINIIESLKPNKPLEPYPSYIDEAYTKLTYTDFMRYRYEEKQYIIEFNSEHNCNPHNPCSEYSEFYEGLNKIRKRYNLNEIYPVECQKRSNI